MTSPPSPVAARGLASEVLDLHSSGAFSFWSWNPETNEFRTYGSLRADTLEEWMQRIHPRDQVVFSEFLDSDRSGAAPYLSLDYRISRTRLGDWVVVRHTAGHQTQDGRRVLIGLVEELTSPRLTRTHLERCERDLRDGETKAHRFIEEALDIAIGGDLPSLLGLLRQILRADTTALVEFDSNLSIVDSVSSNQEASAFPHACLQTPLVAALAQHRLSGLPREIELEIDAATAYFVIRPVLLPDRRVAGVLCAGFRSAQGRLEARRHRALLALAATLMASRLQRNEEELHRRDLLCQLRGAQERAQWGAYSLAKISELNRLHTLLEGHFQLLSDAFESGDWAAWRESMTLLREATSQASELSGQLSQRGGTDLPDLKPCDLNEIVERHISLMRRVLGEDMSLRLDLDPSIGRIEGDEGRLRELLSLLIWEALPWMPTGGELTISTRAARSWQEEETPPSVRLRVADERPRGEEARPFADLAHRDAEENKGDQAVAPYVLASILNEHGAVLESSDAGAIQFLFPAIVEGAASRGGITQAERSDREVANPLAGVAVLLVEDEPSVRRLSRKLLEVLGCSVVEAGSGREALDLWPEIRERVSLVLTDVVMPEGVTGWELARELHQRNPALGILVTSGQAAAPADYGLGEIPQIDFLQKPYAMSHLQATLSRLATRVPT